MSTSTSCAANSRPRAITSSMRRIFPPTGVDYSACNDSGKWGAMRGGRLSPPLSFSGMTEIGEIQQTAHDNEAHQEERGDQARIVGIPVRHGDTLHSRVPSGNDVAADWVPRCPLAAHARLRYTKDNKCSASGAEHQWGGSS